MTVTPHMAEIAALIGDPARANMLDALADGRALTATELSFIAGVSPQTTSGHLAKLMEGRLLALEKQGRHRYYRLASPLVGQMLEAIMALAAVGPPRHRPPSRIDAAMRTARTVHVSATPGPWDLDGHCRRCVARRAGHGLAGHRQKRRHPERPVTGRPAGVGQPAAGGGLHSGRGVQPHG